MITPEVQEILDTITKQVQDILEEGPKFDVETIEPITIDVTIVPTPAIDFIHINK